MKYKTIMILAIFLLSLLAVSAVNASEDVNNTISSDIDDSILELDNISYSTIESPGNEINFDEKEENNILQSTDDDVYSFVDEGAWFNDKIIWYDGDWDNVKFSSFEYVDNLENPENITLLLTCEDNPVANVDLAFLNDYNNKITKLTTDSDGIAVYNIPFNVKQFSFCVSFWYDENHMISCVDVGPNMIYSFDLQTWNNTNWNETEHNNQSSVVNDTYTNGTFTELQNLVNSVPAGSIIYLENDYNIEKEFFEGYGRYFDGIIISKSLTIDGKGHTINGHGERGTVNIFTISADVPVTLKNMILEHGSGAITSVSNLNIINCTFAHNVKLDGDGGAIYCEGKLTVENSNFTDNTAVYMGTDYSLRGGAIICGKESTIFNSTFENNTADFGSAVSGFNSGDVNLTNCTFYKNYGWDNGRLLIDNYLITNGNAINCRFIDYKSSDDIVYGNLLNCIFTGDSILSTNDVTKFYGGSDKLHINLVDSLGNGIGNADVDVDIGGKTSTVKTNSEGHGSFDLDLGVGNYDVVLSYQGILTTSKVTVKSTITASDVSGPYSNSKVSATFLDAKGKVLASKQVTFKIGDRTYSATTNANGVATADVDLSVGTYTVTAINPVNREQKQFNLVIGKANSAIALVSSQNNGVTTLTATLTPAATSGNVLFNVNGEDKSAAIKNGKATLTLSDLEPGDYAVTVSYNGDKNLKASTSNAVTFNVAEVYPILTADPVTKTYGTSTKLVVNLVDSKGNAIANAEVNVDINGQVTPITTDSNGQATMSINKAPGSYTAAIAYADAQTTAKITVKKATPKLTAKAKTFKKSVKTKKYTITLKTNQNKVMKNTKVTLKVNGKTYSAKTNTKGQATFKITKLTKKGKFTATIKYAGSKYYNAKTVNAKITVK